MDLFVRVFSSMNRIFGLTVFHVKKAFFTKFITSLFGYKIIIYVIFKFLTVTIKMNAIGWFTLAFPMSSFSLICFHILLGDSPPIRTKKGGQVKTTHSSKSWTFRVRKSYPYASHSHLEHTGVQLHSESRTPPHANVFKNGLTCILKMCSRCVRYLVKWGYDLRARKSYSHFTK